ncbi:MAG: ABC transporter substrate-binding protein [Actinomycetota bacterium]
MTISVVDRPAPDVLDDLTRREFISGLAAAGLLAACGRERSQAPPEARTRTVSDALGLVKVPIDPQRVVTLDQFSFEAARRLDVPVIGAVANRAMTDPAGVIAPLLAGVESVGTQVHEPNLEAIAALRPDLILGGFPNDSELDSQLKQIAPAYLGIKFESSNQWKEIFTAIGEAVGRRQEAARLLAGYEQRAAEVGARLPQKVAVSSVRAFPDSLYVYGTDTFAGVVLADAAVEIAIPEAGFDGFGSELSLERMGDLTADVLIFWTANEPDPAAVEAQLKNSPLWQRLPAVRSGKVVFGGQHWIGSGLYAAEAVLDDLERALG